MHQLFIIYHNQYHTVKMYHCSQLHVYHFNLQCIMYFINKIEFLLKVTQIYFSFHSLSTNAKIIISSFYCKCLKKKIDSNEKNIFDFPRNSSHLDEITRRMSVSTRTAIKIKIKKKSRNRCSDWNAAFFQKNNKTEEKRRIRDWIFFIF